MVSPRVVLLTSVLCASVASASEAELRLLAPEMGVGQTGAVRVVVRGDRPTAPPRIRLDPSEGLELRFERHSPQVMIVNSRVTRYYEYLYRLTAESPGTYTVGPAEVEIGTRTIQTSSARLKVHEPIEEASDVITAHAGFGVDKAYVGQVVVYKRGLRSPRPIYRDVWSAPPLDGLIPPRDGTPAYAEYTLQGPDGVTHIKEEYHPKVLVSAGSREVSGATVRVEVEQRGGARSRLGIVRTRPQVLATPRATLEVAPLPPSPRAFSGLVGSFSFHAELDRTEAAVGESINLSVKVKGTGTLEGFSLPRLADSVPVKIYDSSPATSAWVDSTGFHSEGSFARVLVPTTPGVLELPPLELITFNPQDSSYETHSVPLPSITVRAGKGRATAAEQFLLDDLDDLDLELAPAYEGVRDPLPGGRTHTAWLGGILPFALGLAVLPLVLLGASEGAAFARRQLSNVRLRPREVEMTPRRRLARLPQEPAARLQALDGALRLALARAVDVPISKLDRSYALTLLPTEVAELVRPVVLRLDRARFAEQATSSQDLESEVRAAVDALESWRGGQP